MKYILVLGDGMADYPISALDGGTPLSVSKTPYMDKLAKSGKQGVVKTVPTGFKPGSDVANLGALGYDATKCYTGRSPLEALSIGIKMEADDLALRTNLVTLSDDAVFENKKMVDYSAGEISTAEARELIAFVGKNLGNEKFNFYSGVSYRHCLIIKHSSPNDILTPPHDISGKVIGEYMPKGAYGNELTSLIKQSYELLKNHPINQKRVLNGQNPANSIWFWGEGTKPSLDNFSSRFHKTGGMISAVDLLKGIAIGSGMTSVDVVGATGTLSTNFDGKAAAAIKLLEDGLDFCMIHLEAPDECGHQGDLSGKIKAIELIDQKIIGTIYEHFMSTGQPFAMLVMPDHFTPISKLTHTSEPVPFLLYSSKETLGSADAYNEKTAYATGNSYQEPWKLTEEFLSL
ncbi:MAG: cofactor-independent phosphoglycerate mutase [Clostridia bacterium]